jgi:ubiquinone/menaquinone biosynthesis C-methylase UbiE
MDEAELDRIDMCHAKYYALLEKKRFLAPIGENPQKILDLGCGTGKATQRLRMAYPNLSHSRDLVYRHGRRVSISGGLFPCH